MKITRAVITAASRDDRHLPLQRLVDRDGTPKAALDELRVLATGDRFGEGG